MAGFVWGRGIVVDGFWLGYVYGLLIRCVLLVADCVDLLCFVVC